MKRISLLFTVICLLQLVLIFACNNQDNSEETQYVLIWSDELNYEGAPDPSVWSYEQGFVRNNELQWYQPENAAVSNGILTISGKKESVPNPGYEAGSPRLAQKPEIGGIHFIVYQNRRR